jgi:hypothetical protein
VQQKEEKEKRKQEKHMARLEKDLLEAKGGKVVLDASRAPRPDDDDDGTHHRTHNRTRTTALTSCTVHQTRRWMKTRRRSTRP